jgi:hypothetical protein
MAETAYFLSSLPNVATSPLISGQRHSLGRGYFVVGGVGCIINVIAAVWYFIDVLGIMLSPYPYLWTADYILLVVGVVFTSLGYLGIHRLYGLGLGLASFVVSIIVSAALLGRTVALVLMEEWIKPYIGILSYLQLQSYISYMVWEGFFSMLILWAVTLIINRGSIGHSRLSVATAIMSIITAAFLEVSNTLWFLYDTLSATSYLYDVYYQSAHAFDLVWPLLFISAEILATLLFFLTKVQESCGPSIRCVL